MTQAAIDSLSAENTNLKKQLENAVNQANGFVAQLDAHKQMLSESIQSSLNLRTTVIMFQRNIQEAQQKNQAAEKQIESLNQQLSDATKEPKNATDKVSK